MNIEQEAKNWMKDRYDITANEYQEKASATAIYPKEKEMEYLTLGLVGEAGEIANKAKKWIRDGAPPDEYAQQRIDMAYEIGDILWYSSQILKFLEMDMGHVMENNLNKLASRKARGTLSGSGDNR